jgi:hypothetical protein
LKLFQQFSLLHAVEQFARHFKCRRGQILDLLPRCSSG